ncbi:unnamed protein product [Cylicocyclus nassatus]|uniref:Vps53 N-terminal domain-containing protein n=1 Tax=Cylicocyclus nassatus TaxID=53992 RepID=A0AA36GXF9_CYLNA|nr:unnamed protein product [Cylicocyclus nassatus]
MLLRPSFIIFAISVVAYSKHYNAGRCNDSEDALNLLNLALEEIFNATLPVLRVHKNVTFSCELAKAVRNGLGKDSDPDVFVIPDIRVYRKRPEIQLVAVEVSSYAIYGFMQKATFAVAYSKQYKAGRCNDTEYALNAFNLVLEEFFNATLPALRVHKNLTFSCELAIAIRNGLDTLENSTGDVFAIPFIRMSKVRPYRPRPEIELIAVAVSSYVIKGFTQMMIPSWYESILQWFGWDSDSNYVFGCYFANFTAPEEQLAEYAVLYAEYEEGAWLDKIEERYKWYVRKLTDFERTGLFKILPPDWDMGSTDDEGILQYHQISKDTGATVTGKLGVKRNSRSVAAPKVKFDFI